MFVASLIRFEEWHPDSPGRIFLLVQLWRIINMQLRHIHKYLLLHVSTRTLRKRSPRRLSSWVACNWDDNWCLSHIYKWTVYCFRWWYSKSICGIQQILYEISALCHIFDISHRLIQRIDYLVYLYMGIKYTILSWYNFFFFSKFLIIFLSSLSTRCKS